MSAERDPRFFALLVHRGLLDVETVRAAVATSDPVSYLLDVGAVTREQWDRWVRTEAGTRPELTRYRLGDLLGQGGTARVFEAVDRKTGDTVALKVLDPKLSRDRTAVAAFVREAKLLMELDHPHIVRGLRVAREGDVFFCAMQKIDGACLQDEIGESRRLDETLALSVVMQVGKALAYLHGRHLVHRDIKPGNIMLTADGRAILIDLGFAVGGDLPADAPADTTSGTAHYISPEQARGQGELDVRADIYSLGATLYHLVTGSLPFEGRSSEEVMAKQVLEALSGEAFRKLGLSPQVHYFIEKMMAKDKEIRFQDPAELVAEIGHYLEAHERERAAAQDALERGKSKRRLRRFM